MCLSSTAVSLPCCLVSNVSALYRENNVMGSFVGLKSYTPPYGVANTSRFSPPLKLGTTTAA